MIDEELLDRFCRNECTEQERQLVSTWLLEHPEDVARLFHEEDAVETGIEPPPGTSEKMLDIIHQKTPGRRPVLPYIKKLAVAASLVILAGSVWYALRPAKIHQERPLVHIQNSDSIGWISYSNKSNKDTVILLADGSRIRLSAASSIRVAQSFGEDKIRAVFLEGEAFFSVRHMADRPFIVHGGGIDAIDIGTTFSMRSWKADDIISVRLFTGKVQVTVSASLPKSFPGKGLLSPGEEFIYSRRTGTADIRTVHHAEDLVSAAAGTSYKGLVTRPDWFRFDEQPLSQVLHQLSVYYRTDILYYPTDLSHCYFTGKFDRKDSLDKILRDLALLNGLTSVKKDKGYILKKQ